MRAQPSGARMERALYPRMGAPRRLQPPPRRPRATAFSSGIVLRPVTLRDDEVELELDADEDETLDHEAATTPQRLEAPTPIAGSPRMSTIMPPPIGAAAVRAAWTFTPPPSSATPLPAPPPSDPAAFAPENEPAFAMAANDAQVMTFTPFGPPRSAMSSAAEIPTVRPPRAEEPAPQAPAQAHPAIGWVLIGVLIGAAGVFVPMSMREPPRGPATPATVYVPIAAPETKADTTTTTTATPAAKPAIAPPKDAMPIPTVSADDLPKTRRRR